MEIQPLFRDLVRSPCPVVDLKGFGRHSQGKTPLLCGSGWATRDPNTCPLYCSPYLTIGMGKGEEWSVFRQGWDWKTSTCEECVTSPQLLVIISTTLWGLNPNLFTFSLLSWLSLNALLYCIASFISKPDQKKFSLALFFYDCLWISKHFRIMQGEKGTFSLYLKWIHSCHQNALKMINKIQTNSRQDRWMR